MRNKKEAQATIEQMILWCTIIAALLLSASLYIKPAVNNATNKLGDILNQEIQDWDK